MEKLIDWLLELRKNKKGPVAVLIIAIAVGLYAWYDWDHVKELPASHKALNGSNTIVYFRNRIRIKCPSVSFISTKMTTEVLETTLSRILKTLLPFKSYHSNVASRQMTQKRLIKALTTCSRHPGSTLSFGVPCFEQEA
jgi:hypothetical protein